MGDRLFGDLHRVALPHLKDGDARLFPHDLELVDRRRAVDVAGDEQRALALVFKVQRQLGGMGGLTGALQAAHHDDRRGLAGKVQAGVFRAHQRGQLVVDDLDDHLRGREALEDLVPHRLGGDVGDELLGDLVVDVRLEQRETHLAHRLLDVALLEPPLVAHLFEDGGKLVGQAFKWHGVPS